MYGSSRQGHRTWGWQLQGQLSDSREEKALEICCLILWNYTAFCNFDLFERKSCYVSSNLIKINYLPVYQMISLHFKLSSGAGEMAHGRRAEA